MIQKVIQKVISQLTNLLHSNSVTHTERSGNMWWEVDLGRVYNIQSINIYGRTDCCDDRIDGARVGDVI